METLNAEHDALKQYAHQLLLTMGFKDSEIQEEYVLRPSHREYSKGNQPQYKRELHAINTVRVDVVGISERFDFKHKVAIECGITNSENLAMEKLFFDEVIVLPFFKMDTERVLLERRIQEVLKELANMKSEYETYKNKQETLLKLNHQEFMRFLIRILQSVANKSSGSNLETTYTFSGPYRQALTNAYYALANEIKDVEYAKDKNETI